MNSWPFTLPQPTIGIEEEHYKPAKKTEFEANYTQTRLTASRSRKKFPLNWKYLSETDYQTLETFFDNNQGSMFYWTHPITSVTHNCTFSGDTIKSKWHTKTGRTDIQCPIEEV